MATLVHGGARRVIFEPVSSHHSSVFAVHAKLHDISLADNAPGRVAVVRKKAELKTYLAVLQESADVIEREVPNETFQRIAEAA